MLADGSIHIGLEEFFIDVSHLTGMDSAGRQLIEVWESHGARFVANSEESQLFVESIAGPIPFTMRSSTAPRSRLTPRLAALTLVVAVSLLLPVPVLADDGNTPSPDAVLSRLFAAGDRSGITVDGETVVIDIEAELLKFAKKGRLRAIRRLVPFGKPEYEMLESGGDRTVRQQVIARYLSADAQSRSLPRSEVAVTPLNYKIRFLTAIGAATTLTYVFRITPKKKRMGMMQGELWIDAATGITVHQAGRLVKQPSIFVRRVDIVQDTDIREGSPYLRITRLGIETRLAGRAELTIREHPGRCADRAANATMSSPPLDE